MAEVDLTEIAVILQDTLARIDNTILVTAAPAPELGSLDAVAIDLQNNRIYGPKTVAGWGAGRPTVGGPGPAVELQKSATHIQWRVVGATAWINLVALVDLKGADGREIELRANATHIQWRLAGSNWADLIALTALKGADGRDVQLQRSATHIQWRYAGAPTWTDLVVLTDLIGPAGSNGWTQVESIVADGERRVKRIVDWIGGTGTKPATGKYVGSAGLVDTAAEATDVRGPGGSGSGDMQGANNLSDLTDRGTARSNLSVYSKAETDAALGGKQDKLGFTPEDVAKKGVANGYAGLGTDGKVPAGQLDLPKKSTGAGLRAATNDTDFLTPKSVADAAALVALTDAGTIAVDLGAGTNFIVTLGGNRTLGAPTNAKPGMSGTILIKQDATGSRTLSYASAWMPIGSTPALSTAANAVDLLTWIVETSSKISFTLTKGRAA